MRRALLVALVTLAAGVAGWADDDSPRPVPPDAHAAAEAYLSAFQEGDQAMLDVIARAPALDPFEVAIGLYLKAVRTTSETQLKRETVLEAMADLARRTADRKDAGDLAGVVGRLAGAPEEAWARDLRITRVVMEGARLLQAKAPPGDQLDVLLRAEPDLAAESPSVPGVLALDRIAANFLELRRGEQALTTYRRAAAMAEVVGWPRQRAALWSSAARVAVSLGDWPSAFFGLRKLVLATAALGDSMWQARALSNQAFVLRHLGRYQAAIDVADEAERLSREIGDEDGARTAAIARGGVLAAVGRRQEAEEVYRSILRQLETMPDPFDEFIVKANLALVIETEGRLSEALSLHEEALAIVETLDRPLEAANGLRNAGSLLRRLGDTERALECQRAALELYESAGNRGGVAACLMNLGSAYSDAGRLEEARDHYMKALALEQGLENPPEYALLVLNLARLELRRGNPQASVEFCQEATKRFVASGYDHVPTYLHLAYGDALQALGRLDDAIDRYRQAVVTAERGAERGITMAQTQWSLAHALLEAKRPREALEPALRCMELRQQSLAGFGEGEASELDEDAFYAAGLGVATADALRVAKEIDEDGAGVLAFQFAEGGRAVALAEGLSSRQSLLASSLPVALGEAEATSREQLDRARGRLSALLRRPTASAEDLQAGQAGVTAALRARDEVIARIQRESKRISSVVLPSPLGFEEARVLLAPHEAMVLYQIAGTHAFAVVLRTGGVRLVNLGPTDGLTEAVEDFHRLASVPGGPEAGLARRLHARLVEPLREAIGDASTLLISPDGPLVFLPFEALGPTPQDRLVQHVRVAYVPSATVYGLLESDARAARLGSRVIAVGDPAYVDAKGEPLHWPWGRGIVPALPGSGLEAKDVAERFSAERRELLLGEHAGRADLLAALEHADDDLGVLHVACHAYVDERHSHTSGLLLAHGEILDVDQIYRLRAEAGLVVLSACRSGRGAFLHGEGVMGFTRAFFHAGSPRVIASLFSVSDAATREFMGRFYAALERPGVGPAEALRLAKVAAMEAGGEDAHPNRWAAFVLWGRPD